MLILNALCTNPGCNKPADYIFQVFTTEKTQLHALKHNLPLEKAREMPVGYAGDVYICLEHATYVMESPKFIKNWDLTFNVRLFRNFWSLLDHYSERN